MLIFSKTSLSSPLSILHFGWSIFHHIFLMFVLTEWHMSFTCLFIEFPIAPFALNSVIIDIFCLRLFLCGSESTFRCICWCSIGRHHSLPELQWLHLPLRHFLTRNWLILSFSRATGHFFASFFESKRLRKLIHCRFLYILCTLYLSLFFHVEGLSFLALGLLTNSFVLFDCFRVELAITMSARDAFTRSSLNSWIWILFSIWNSLRLFAILILWILLIASMTNLRTLSWLHRSWILLMSILFWLLILSRLTVSRWCILNFWLVRKWISISYFFLLLEI